MVEKNVGRCAFARSVEATTTVDRKHCSRGSNKESHASRRDPWAQGRMLMNGRWSALALGGERSGKSYSCLCPAHDEEKSKPVDQ